MSSRVFFIVLSILSFAIKPLYAEVKTEKSLETKEKYIEKTPSDKKTATSKKKKKGDKNKNKGEEKTDATNDPSKPIETDGSKIPDVVKPINQEKDPSGKESGTSPATDSTKNLPQKLPLPRFVCLKSTASNMHVGPGDQYPIEWRYTKQFLPVEIIAEFDHWRQIKDVQGTVGWVHKTLLSSKRFAMIQNKVVNLYADPSMGSKVIATVEPGVISKVIECNTSLCRVDIQGIRGWIKRDFLYGVYPDEMRF
ncbi:MAG: hypothetical protein K2X98_06120 [Alphaproteobacteria bacterium]|nr:hypothetical protein [Alphaproteobacteria bacterium]